MQNSIKERIRMLLGAMGDDEFERFMSDLLPRVYPGYDRLEPSFNFIGKTTKGKCDAYVYHAGNDTYTAIICTTRQSDVHSKVLDDINKLAATKFSAKIRRVLLCVNTPVKDEVEEYRAACNTHGWELDPFSLERITRHTLAENDLLRSYFGEVLESALPTDVFSLGRRFDCGLRLKEAREDVKVRVSELIEKIDFPSEREWNAIESAEIDVKETYLRKVSALTGISMSWLKHEAGPKYPHETIFDYQSDKILSIASESPLASYVAIEPVGMDIVLIVQFSELRWHVYTFGFSMNFWNWIDDQAHIPIIFKLLACINQSLDRPWGRVISQSLLREFSDGVRHPSQIFKMAGENSYWFDDLFDLHHRFSIAKDKYQHYGDWFVQLQNYFRAYVKQEPLVDVGHDAKI